MRVLGVIPARCGSKRVPHKNLAFVGDVPLVLRAVHQAMRSEELGPLIVSTDCVGVVQTLGRMGTIAHERRCGPDGPMVDVLLETLKMPWDVDAVCCIQPTSPFRLGSDIDACIKLLEQGARSVVSVNEESGERNSAVYVTRVDMLRDGLVFDAHSAKYAMSAERSMDINEPADLERARWVARERGW